MVSNYVKKGIISHPVKKKYTREQLASLIYIVVSKTVLSMENIDTLFKMQRQHFLRRSGELSALRLRPAPHHPGPCRRRRGGKAAAPQHHHLRRQQDVSGLCLRRHAAGGSPLAGHSRRPRLRTPCSMNKKRLLHVRPKRRATASFTLQKQTTAQNRSSMLSR